MLQWGVIVQRPPGLSDEQADQVGAKFAKFIGLGFQQDVEIWRHKSRIDNPLLCAEDGPVYQLRRWYEQFYTDVADIAAGHGGAVRVRGRHHPGGGGLGGRGRARTWPPGRGGRRGRLPRPRGGHGRRRRAPASGRALRPAADERLRRPAAVECDRCGAPCRWRSSARSTPRAVERGGGAAPARSSAPGPRAGEPTRADRGLRQPAGQHRRARSRPGGCEVSPP